MNVKCADPKCGKSFKKITAKQKYCCYKCADRHKHELARMKMVEYHPCKVCGKPISNRHRVRCDECVVRMAKTKGVKPMDTPAMDRVRKREQEMIDRIVAQAKEKEQNYYRLDSSPRLSGVRVG